VVFGKFTYPFCYVPHTRIREAALELISRINGDTSLSDIFSEGKMMGVLIASGKEGKEEILYAFSGLACGKSHIEGFVPPIFDTQMLRSANSADDSRALQKQLFRSYIVHNALGEKSSIDEIFARRGLVPPGGTGDCAAPKLLEYAYRNSLQPLAMGEFWYGKSPCSEVRQSGRFYPSCTGKCGPLLTWMMQGLDVEENPLDKTFTANTEPSVIYSDEDIIVADKPSGMLSVPGRTNAKSLLEWLSERFGEVHSCHRLDMDTSGIMVFARNLQSKTALELQFADHKVEKTYIARLSAPSASNYSQRNLRKGAHGTIALPLGFDYYDRPRQLVDSTNGKKAITEYEITDVLPNGEVEVKFIPKTGRTHQLRVHAAHKEGLGRPIKGDKLYGDSDGDRLWLHAESIRFEHPTKKMSCSFTATTHLTT